MSIAFLGGHDIHHPKNSANFTISAKVSVDPQQKFSFIRIAQEMKIADPNAF